MVFADKLSHKEELKVLPTGIYLDTVKNKFACTVGELKDWTKRLFME